MSRHHRHKNGEGPVRCDWTFESEYIDDVVRCPEFARYTLSADSENGFTKPAKRYCRPHLFEKLDIAIRQARHPSEGWARVRFAPGLIDEYESLGRFDPGDRWHKRDHVDPEMLNPIQTT